MNIVTMESVADLGELRGYSLTYLPPQEIQKDGCAVIETLNVLIHANSVVSIHNYLVKE